MLDSTALVALASSIAGAYTGGIIWGIRLEGRVNQHDSVFDEREKLARERQTEIINRLERIERKQDASNGKH